MRIRRSVHDKIPVQPQNRTSLTSPFAPEPTSKLPLLIKGKIVLDVSRKTYFKNSKPPEQLVLASVVETDKGLVRDYNEDKYMIANEKINSAPVHFFGLYDGHGGSRCSEYLRQHLHDFILKDPDLPSDPKNVILRNFIKAENLFIEEAKRNGFDRSGSCALTCVIIRDKCFIANLGDSRAVLSSNKGSKVFVLSKDHKPSDEGEMNRIVQAGGMCIKTVTIMRCLLLLDLIGCSLGGCRFRGLLEIFMRNCLSLEVMRMLLSRRRRLKIFEFCLSTILF